MISSWKLIENTLEHSEQKLDDTFLRQLKQRYMCSYQSSSIMLNIQ